MVSISGELPLDWNWKRAPCRESIVINRIYLLRTIHNMTHLHYMGMQTLTRRLASRPGDCLVELLFVSLVALLHTKQNFTLQLPDRPLKLSLWPLTIQERWYCLSAAYFGIWISLKRQQQFCMRTMMPVRLWGMRKSPPHVLDIWTSNIFQSANGWNETLCIWNELTHRSTWLTTSRRPSTGHYSIDMRIFCWDMFHQCIPMYTTQLSACIPIRIPQLNILFLRLLLPPCVPQLQGFMLRFRKIMRGTRGFPFYYGMVSPIHHAKGIMDCGGGVTIVGR